MNTTGSADHGGLVARFDAALQQAETLAGELVAITSELRAYVTHHHLADGGDLKEGSQPDAAREDPGPGSEDRSPASGDPAPQ